MPKETGETIGKTGWNIEEIGKTWSGLATKEISDLWANHYIAEHFLVHTWYLVQNLS